MGFDFAYEDELHQLDSRKLEILNDIEALEAQIKLSATEVMKLPKGSSLAIEARKQMVELKKESLVLKVEQEELSRRISEVLVWAFRYGLHKFLNFLS